MEDKQQIRMLDRTDGPEAGAGGKKRMLEERNAPGGPQAKRHKHEESNMNPTNASGSGAGPATTPAPHPSVPRIPARSLYSANTSGQGSGAKTAAVAASASTNG